MLCLTVTNSSLDSLKKGNSTDVSVICVVLKQKAE